MKLGGVGEGTQLKFSQKKTTTKSKTSLEKNNEKTVIILEALESYQPGELYACGETYVNCGQDFFTKMRNADKNYC